MSKYYEKHNPFKYKPDKHHPDKPHKPPVHPEPCPPVVPCFIAGTKIATRKGLVDISNLKVGDFVLTRDNGLKEITWMGRAAATTGKYQIEDAFFSPNHRILTKIKGEEAFLPAKKLENAVFHPGNEVYFHFTLDMHEVVLAESVWCETFYPGYYIMSNMDQEAYDEIVNLFPDWRNWDLARMEAANVRH